MSVKRTIKKAGGLLPPAVDEDDASADADKVECEGHVSLLLI